MPMKGAVIFLSVLVAVAALARTATMPPLPAPAFADTEVVTNMPMLSVDVAMRRVSLSLAFAATPSNCVEVVFGTDLNDADVLDGGATNRPERIRPVTLNLQAPQGTSGIVLVSAEGDSGMELFRVVDGVTNRVNPMTAIPLSVTDGFACTGSCTIYASCPGIGSGVLSATFCPTNGGVATYLTADASFKCIEPLRKLVSMRQMPDGRFYNPSRLVMGTNAVLQVGVNGDFDATNVHWHVVSGSADISPTNGFTTTVVPTGANEDVVIEACFNDDEIQPRFKLPVVYPRTIPVKVFMVSPPEDEAENAWNASKIQLMFDVANEIYSQVGINFAIVNIAELSFPSNNYWNLEVTHMEKDENGEEYETYTDEAWALLNQYDSGDRIEVYFVGELVNANALASWSKYGILVSKEAFDATLAHELGHAFDLYDCYPIYQYRTNGNYAINYIQHYCDPVDFLVLIGQCDWGRESGRGFYEITDTYGKILRTLLMYGYCDRAGYDIPDGKACSLRHGAQEPYETIYVKVGAEDFEKDLTEVYSK